MSQLKFSDGEIFDLSGDLRVELRSDGYYVLGQGMMMAVDTLEQGQKIIADKNSGKKILFEKRHPNSCKCAVSGWVSYDWNKPETRPTKYGKYFVHRKDGKTHWETWNGSGWAYNGNVITFWMDVLPPCH